MSLFPKQVNPIKGDGITNITGKNKLGCYAFFPDTGPSDKTCLDCVFFKETKKAGTFVLLGKCGKWQEVAKAKKGPEPVKPAPSCKYFEEKK